MPETALETVEALKSILDSLEKTSLWGLGTITAIAQAAIYSDTIIDIPGIKIPRELSGVIIFAVLCGLNFQLLRLFQLLGHFLSQLNSGRERAHALGNIIDQPDDCKRAYSLLKTHKWIFNPFAETNEWGSTLTDLFGLSLLLLLWWLGLHAGLQLLRTGTPTLSRLTVGYALLILYLVFGAMSARVIWMLMRLVGQTKTLIRLKASLAVASMFIGCFGIGTLFLKQFFLGDAEKARRALQALHLEFSDSSFLKTLRTGDGKTVALFLAAGISPNAEDDKGNTALIKASESGFTDIVRTLIKYGAKLNTKSQDYDDTALAAAAGAGQAEIVQLLLAAGADLELKGYKERTPLARSCFSGQEEVVKVLLHAGAKLEPRDIVNDTPLISATDGFSHGHLGGDLGIVSLLIAAGADVNPVGGFGTPLGNASEHGDAKIVRTLLNAGAKVTGETRVHTSPLFGALNPIAIGQGGDAFAETIHALVKAGANVNEKRNDGTTPLMSAVGAGDVEIVKLLIDAGADVKAKDDQGRSVMDHAAKNRRMQEVLKNAIGKH